MDSIKLKLRPWLISRIDSNAVPGLSWLKREDFMFKIPWKHHGKQDWTEADAQIFKEWAIYTGKFKEGGEPDYALWKTRLRCALYKLPDVEEIKIKHKENNCPYRVYRFLNSGSSQSVHSAEGGGALEDSVPDGESVAVNLKHEEEDLSRSDAMETDDPTLCMGDKGMGFNKVEAGVFELCVYYKNELQLCRRFENSCCLFWRQTDEAAPELPYGGTTIRLPDAGSMFNTKQREQAQQILDGLDSLLLHSDLHTGELYAQRSYSDTRPFYRSVDSGKPVPVARGSDVSVFSLPTFLNQLKNGYGSSATAYISFGQKWSGSDPLRKCLICLAVTNLFAQEMYELEQQFRQEEAAVSTGISEMKTTTVDCVS